MLNYKIVIYNHGKKVKVLHRVKYYGEASKLYAEELKNNIVYFKREYNWLGQKTDYEIVLVAPMRSKPLEFIRNEMNALIAVKPKGNFVIKKINEYYIEETFTDRLQNKKITFKDLIKKHLENKKTNVVFRFNNKLVIEDYDTGELELYTVKNRYDCLRLFNVLKSFTVSNRLNNYLFFVNPAYDIKRRIYETLEKKYGVSKVYMKKVQTH